MVKVLITKEDSYYKSFTMEGHAGFNPSNDIVCSAISVLGYTLAGSLNNKFPNYPPHEIKSLESGLVDITFKKCSGIEFNTIIETIILGLLQVELKYPENITIEVKEV